ncbi:MAG: M23 family metallopeptidase [Pedosphaera sp.]|nr:M23 family metallopeptidase [Pedosphaera sp.]
MKARFVLAWAFLLGWIGAHGASPLAQSFNLPTANRALFEKDGEEKFFVGTVGKPWTSGTFGCVRSDGWQIHEGLDIRCLQRDKKNEPTDPVLATADGTVAYRSNKPSLSNYGNYLILRHQVNGLEIFSLYAHLREIRTDLKAGQAVKAGETIATMGRTSNTREGISRDRAHVHFELNLFYNDAFKSFYKKNSPNQRNDHGDWNGQNLVALDPRLIFLEQQKRGPKFSLLHHIQSQTELCRVTVRATNFPWLKRYAPLVKTNTVPQGGIAGYEVALNFNALPFELIPRAASELKGKTKFQLLSVNEAEQKKNPARRLVTQKSGRWELTSHGLNALELLTFPAAK